MRFGRFTLERYGPFEHLELPFDPAPGRVNLIIAPNGFGKSVIRRAIGEFLFRIEERTPMDFRFGTERMRILADVLHNGAARSLIRRKGRGNTLANADGTDVSPEEARQIVGGADETVFRELFGLDTALLRSGGASLMRTQGRLGQVLFAAGGGMGRVRELLTEFEAKRDDLGRATIRHKSRPLWSALTNWEQAAAELRRVSLRPEGWSKLERDAADAVKQLETLLAEQSVGATERDTLRTIGAARPWLDKLHAAQEVLAHAGDAPELDGTFESRWREALEVNAKAMANALTAETALLAANEARASLNFDPAWLEAGIAIDALAPLQGQATGAETDLPGVRSEMAEKAAEAARLRRDLGWAADMAPPPAPEVKDAQRRLGQYQKLETTAASAEKERAEAEVTLSLAQAELAELPDENDITQVADFAKQLRSAGDPAALIDAARRKLRLAEAALAKALHAIPDQPFSEQMLNDTAAPSDPSLDAAVTALGTAEAAHVRAVEQHTKRVASIDANRKTLAGLEQSAALPPQDALDASRARRDAIWARLCEPAATGPGPETAVAFDRAMREADAIADALIAHGREVAEAAALRGGLASQEAELKDDGTLVAQTSRALIGARNELSTIAHAAGGKAHEPPALRAFLRGRADAIQKRLDRDAAAVELSDTEATLIGLGAQLANAMDVPRPETSGLDALLTEAGRRLAAADRLAAQRVQLVKQVRDQRARLASRANNAETAARALHQWRGEWSPVARLLARPDAEAPSATADVLTLVEDLRRTEGEHDGLRRRIDNMRAAIALLAEKVGGLAGLCPELAALPPAEAATMLRGRLEHERREAARCQDADARIEAATKHLVDARANAEAAARTLTGLRAALNAATNDAAEFQLQRARAAAAARKDGAEAVRELTVQAGGMSLEVLSARVLETTAEADTDRIETIDSRQRELAALISAARDQSTGASQALEQAGSGLEASDAARRRESAQAMLARTAEEALVLHAAHALLQAALDRQASGADQPLLTRIGDVFRTITNATHAGVRIEETKDGQTMVALEADGITRKALDHLSEGTSDQLYLALRIAALEDYAAVASPLPFIADDVLQTFDDPRTAATMRALLELSDKVQVIALTHHPHVERLAATLPAGAMNVIRLN